MQELIQLLKDKASLNDEQAAAAIQVVQEYIHSKVPPMFSSFVDNFFSGGATGGGTDSFMS